MRESLQTRAKWRVLSGETDSIRLLARPDWRCLECSTAVCEGDAAVANNRFYSILTGVELAAASAPAEVAPMGVGFGLAPSWSFSAEYNHLSMGGNTLVDSRASTTASAVMGATNGSLLIKTSLQQAEP